MIRLVAILIAISAFAEEGAYRASIAAWRQQKEAELKADGGWLTVTGLIWLKEGENRVPAAQGVFELQGGKTLFHPDQGAPVEMKKETSITEGTRTFFVIQRGDKYGVRVKDTASQIRAEFTGQRWFPARESYRVTARFVSYPQPKILAIPNILGSGYPSPRPGYAVFRLEGRELRV